MYVCVCAHVMYMTCTPVYSQDTSYNSMCPCACVLANCLGFQFPAKNEQNSGWREFLGYWVKEGLRLVVHISSGCVAKINIP